MKTVMVRVMVKMKNKTMETIWWIVTVSARERETGSLHIELDLLQGSTSALVH